MRLAILLVLWVGCWAEASIMTWQFSGTAKSGNIRDAVGNRFDLAGEPFFGSFSIASSDLAAPDMKPEPQSGRYAVTDPTSTLEITAGGVTLAFGMSRADINNDANAFGGLVQDLFSIRLQDVSSVPIRPDWLIAIQVWQPVPNDYITSDAFAVPSSIDPALAGFPSEARITFETGRLVMDGALETLSSASVPEPSAIVAWLCLAGCAATVQLLASRRRPAHGCATRRAHVSI